MANGDIDFIVAADATFPLPRNRRSIAGEIEGRAGVRNLAKKLLHRLAGPAARDIYDLSAAIDLMPAAASTAARAARSKRDLLARRFAELADRDASALLAGIVPYDGRLPHADGMVAKVKAFVLGEIDRASAERSGDE